MEKKSLISNSNKKATVSKPGATKVSATKVSATKVSATKLAKQMTAAPLHRVAAQSRLIRPTAATAYMPRLAKPTHI
jgi:hypothetical protein